MFSKEDSEGKFEDYLENEHITDNDRHMGLLIIGRVEKLKNNFDDDSEDSSDDMGKVFNSLGPIFRKYHSIQMNSFSCSIIPLIWNSSLC